MTATRAGGTLALVLGDQLHLRNPALAGLDPARDTVLFVEAPDEGAHVWSHQARIALFLSAMRHFAETLAAAGHDVAYLRLGTHPHRSLGEAWRAFIVERAPARVACCEPGDWRVLALLQDTCAAAGVALALLPDPHFICSRDDFHRWAGDAGTLRMEFFYRHLRRRENVLMDGREPAGGRWNFDADNRKGFGARGPGRLPEVPSFAPDAITRAALADVATHFASHPGSTAQFDWPVTAREARAALAAFVRDRLPGFGPHQDAMWTGMAVGWHAKLAAALNLKLLDPREVIAAAVDAWREGRAPLASVEGFVRQVLGWREFIRGVYWREMPGLAQANFFGHARGLPAWYWTGATDMRCMRETVGQTLATGYAHHIQRLMVTGNFALLAQVRPQDVCDWYLAVYVDAVDWVERPNVAGMALFADGGRFTSKPYVASGQYVKRMSDYCRGCRYDPARASGDGACPLTALYWRFLLDHERWLAGSPRTALMVRSAARLDDAARRAIRVTSDRMLADPGAL